MRTSKLAVSLIFGKLAATTAQGPYSCGDGSEPLNVIEGKYDLKLIDIHEMKHDRIIMVDIYHYTKLYRDLFLGIETRKFHFVHVNIPP